jgi:signal transduction histidine kinase/CheY-like chemotaxis protein
MVMRETKAALEGVKPYDVKYRQVLPDHSIKQIHTRAEVVRAKDGTPILMRGITCDISEQVQAEIKLHDAMAEVERVSNAKSDFLSKMSHELRAPMNIVLGFAQLLDMDQKEPLSVAQRKNVHYILNQGEHLLNLIDEILDISQIETGQLKISPEPVDVSAVISELSYSIEPLASKHQVHIDLHPSISEPNFVYADPQRLRQVLLNMITNAIKFNQIGGNISLSSQAFDSNALRICIQDTGIGIKPEKIDMLFTPFVRLSEAQRNAEGVGLGLALSKHMMELMNGDIGVESTPGRGSTFWIELPLAKLPEKNLALNVQKTEPDKLFLPACTLLYIEDYEANCTLLRKGLDSFPHVELLWASDGTSGLAMAKQQPDLILLDLGLPDIQGIDVLENLKQDKSTNQIPVVVLSADATKHRIQYLLEAGALAYVTKPYKMKEMLRSLQEWLP